jgi:hypothetical protein
MNAFTLSTGEEMVEQGDFYSLMFFVVALAILVIYFLFGFYTNEVSQVSLLPHLPRNKVLTAQVSCPRYSARHVQRHNTSRYVFL